MCAKYKKILNTYATLWLDAFTFILEKSFVPGDEKKAEKNDGLAALNPPRATHIQPKCDYALFP